MNVYTARLMLPLQERQDWKSPHLNYLSPALYLQRLFHGRRRPTRD